MVDLGPLAQGYPSYPLVFANGVNLHGVVVGDSSRLPEHTHAARWPVAESQPNVVDDLGAPIGTLTSTATAINDHGTIVGYATAGNGTHSPLVWSNPGGMQLLGDLPGGGTSGRAFDINNAEVAVGVSAASTGNRAFRWTAGGGMTDLGDLPGGTNFSEARGINELGEIVGVSGATGGDRAFVWREGAGLTQLTLPAGGETSAAYGINDLGEVVGKSQLNSGGFRYDAAVMWAPNGEVQDLGSLGTESSRAVAINNSSWVVGQSYDNEGLAHGFVWSAQFGMAALDELIVDVPADFRIFDATAINDRGQITALAWWTRGVNAILLTPVPEPTGGVLMAAAALVLGWRTLRRCA